ncbi:MAG: polymer-forming cytoskeletal protein [Crocinitomicaceae bacterium]|nr:polymer-forming cytoskeletal protein [Crocinitomicaceae bacterium]
MFKGGNQVKPSDNNSPDRLNRIVEGTEVTGNIKTESNIRIDGILNGNLHTSGRLVIGPSGFIKGEITCGNADVEGTIEGNIHVSNILTLRSSAKVQGNIVTGKIVIENGADFDGNCRMANGKDVSELAKDLPELETEEEPSVVY